MKEILITLLCDGYRKAGMAKVEAEHKLGVLKKTIEKIVEHTRYEYYKRKKLKWAKEHDCYDRYKAYYDDNDHYLAELEKLSDSLDRTKKEARKADVLIACLRMQSRLDGSDKDYHDRFLTDRNGNKRLIAGEVYHYLYYTTYADGDPVNHCAEKITCVRVENGNYLLEQPDGQRFWIRFEDLGLKTDLDDPLDLDDSIFDI